MILARANIVIDPSQASSGAAAAVTAAKAVNSALKEAASAANGLGSAFGKMQSEVQRGGGVIRGGFAGMVSAASGAVKAVLAVGAAFGAL